MYIKQVSSMTSHPHFRQVVVDEADPVVVAVRLSTEEGKKVARIQGETWLTIFEKFTCSG